MKRLLVLATASQLSAATRFRIMAYERSLADAGIQLYVSPFLDDHGFEVVYRPGRRAEKVAAAMRACVRRVADVVRSTQADAVVIQREAALVGPPMIEWLLTRAIRKPVLFDFDDAIWVPYVSPTYGATLSRLLKAPWKTEFTVRHATTVLAGNPYLFRWAEQRNRDVRLMPTVVDTAEFRPGIRSNHLPVLGWVGTHSTAQYLCALLPVLRRLAERRAFLLRVIGAQVDAPGVMVDARDWQLEREVAEFQQLDIGLYPLVEDPWSVGKSAFKAIQYMACGVPVVASPVGFTTEVVRHGATGYLASDETAWVEYLTELIDDASLRRRLGEQGRADAVEKWSLDVYAPRFVSAITDAMR